MHTNIYTTPYLKKKTLFLFNFLFFVILFSNASYITRECINTKMNRQIKIKTNSDQKIIKKYNPVTKHYSNLNILR